MLKEDVEECRLGVDLRGKKEVARGGGEFGVDKTAARQTQRAPIDAVSELARKVGLEKSARVVGVRESRLDQLVMGLVKRTLGLGHGFKRWQQTEWSQRVKCDDFVKMRQGLGKIMDSKIILSGACPTGGSSGLLSSAV